MAEIGYRDATAADRDWLYELKRVTMKDYVTETFGWDESFQRHRFEEDFDPKRGRIIQIDGEDGGFLDVDEKPDHVALNRIELLPRFQRQGIGSRVVRAVIGDAARSNKPVILQVLRVNPALALYERLGFRAYGETRTHYKMSHAPLS